MRKLASIQTVNAVEPIPNADAIEKIRVLGWWVVVKKGEHQPGDKLIYCEIDSLLPERPEFEFLRANSFKPAQTDATGVVMLRAGFRIKTLKLRGQVSQGFCRFRFCLLKPRRKMGPTSPTCWASSNGSRQSQSAWAGK
jgi:RNA ligase (TIGR02306 family)